MARMPRFNVPGYPQHVIHRGNNLAPCFFAEQDYRRYLDDLAESARKFGCHIHAYVLMTNHVHLLITPTTNFAISAMMQALGRRYVYYVNHHYRRTGTLWEGRFKASLIDSEAYLLTCMRYIEMNPVRADMVAHPGEYRWSSYAGNAQGRVAPLLSYHALYLALGKDDAERQHAYRELFRQHMDDESLHEIREALNNELVLGRSWFKDKIEVVTERQTRHGQPGRPCIKEAAGDFYVKCYD